MKIADATAFETMLKNT